MPGLSRSTEQPDPQDRARGDRALDAFAEFDAVRPEPPEHPEHPKHAELIRQTAAGSPYLARLIEREAAWLADVLASGDLTKEMETLFVSVAAAKATETEATLMQALRIAKARAALLIALADLSGQWSLDQVTSALTDFADACVNTALDWLLGDTDGAGLFILAMGKHGAHELNYSSDIDLIIFFDMEGIDPATYGERKQRFNRLTRRFVKIMQEQTAEGYVFRTDLRLRPDPGSTAACLSVDAAERYYESFGKSWERAAYIKARVIAGDHAAGERFLSQMQPFVWRRNLDFAAMEDVRDIKRLMHQHKGHADIRSAGHDIKIGRGGIREIEFFAQTQQLIAGGREPALRVPRTLDALGALTRFGWVKDATRAALAESYVFLRTLEHRIQMTDDAQTHRLPEDDAALARLAAFAGFEDTAALDTALQGHLHLVSAHFQTLFEELRDETEALPQTEESLKALLSEHGFSDLERGAALLSRWRDGAITATKTERARAILDRISPKLLASLGHAGDPDHALLAFDRFLSALPAGVQILSLFEANPNLLDLLTEICATAPALGAYLSKNAQVFDAVLARDFFDPLPGSEALLEEHQTALKNAPEGDFEALLDASRRWNKERHFQIGVQLLQGAASPKEAGKTYADIADAAIQGIVPAVTEEMARRHGPPPGIGACVIAMGRLGAAEMTTSSDLDLLVVYDEGAAEASDGPSPLDPVRYYARWTQRLVRALTAPTAEGAVYEVDMRLRPSGRSGPLATRIASFERYQLEEAWTWEHMALTRARVICGPADLRRKIEETIAAALTKPRDMKAARADALEMRLRTRDAAPENWDNPWALKTAKGGIMDADFVIQTLLLGTGKAGMETVQADHATQEIAASGVLSAAETADLIASRNVLAQLIQLVRLTETGTFDPMLASSAQKALFSRILGEPDFERVIGRLAEAQTRIKTLFADQIGSM